MTTYIHPTAVIHPTVTIGKNLRVLEFCTIGAEPFVIRRYKYKPPEYSVTIGDDVNIHSRTQVVRGTTRHTVIGDKVCIAQQSNIGHDSIIREKTLINAGCLIAGHVEIGQLCNIGMGVQVKEHVRIGDGSVVGMGATVTKDIPANSVAVNMVDGKAVYCKVLKRKELVDQAKDLVKRAVF